MTGAALALLETQVEPFLGVFLRVTGIFVMTPVLGSQEIPATVRAMGAFLLALVIYPVVAPHLAPVPRETLALGLRFAGEFGIGLLVGLIVLLAFTAFQLAGEFYSLQMGFGIINVVDPLSQSQVPILGSFKSTFALGLFLLSDGLHAVIAAVAGSFARLPALDLAAMGPIQGVLLTVFTTSFEAALRLAAPLMAVIFLVELLMGILAKTAPQMNIMVVGFQIKIVVGLLCLVVLWPVLWHVGGRIFEIGYGGIDSLIRGAGAAAAG